MLAPANLFTLEPRDTLLVRDGRAMNGNVGRALLFPHPSTLAGLVRTRLGLDDKGRFAGDAKQLREEVSVMGPLLARLASDSDKLEELFAPAPRDCVWFAGDDEVRRGHRLVARRISEMVDGARTDLDGDAALADFEGASPVGKPKGGPAFWPWTKLLDWLAAPHDGLLEQELGGLKAFEPELRTHVTINPETSTAEDGALFSIEGVRLVRARREREVLALDRFALLGAWAGPNKLKRGLVPLGGKRRTAFLEPVTRDGRLALDPPSWLDGITPGKTARVVLLTPAIFTKGSFPDFIHGARVIAAKVDRPEVVSGWDFATNRPKPTRRMAPAGSVYWVEVPSGEWARSSWLTAVSDDKQDQRDGFGLAVVGVAR